MITHVNVLEVRVEALSERLDNIAEDMRSAEKTREECNSVLSVVKGKYEATEQLIAILRTRKRNAEFDAIVARSDLAHAKAVRESFDSDAAANRVDRAMNRPRTSLPSEVCQLIASKHMAIRARGRTAQLQHSSLSITVDFAGDVVSPQGVSIKTIISPTSCTATPPTTRTVFDEEVLSDGSVINTIREYAVPATVDISYEARSKVSDLGVTEVPLYRRIILQDIPAADNFDAISKAKAFIDTIARIHKRTGCPKKPLNVVIESTIGKRSKRRILEGSAWKKRDLLAAPQGTLVGTILEYFEDVAVFCKST